MEWEALGAIGEVIGALAVFVTLLYLAKQIRISNKAADQTAQRELVEYTGHLLSQLSSDSQLVDLWVRGSADDESLTTAERVQYRSFLMQLISLWERVYRLRRDNSLPDWIWDNTSGTRIQVMGSPGFKSYFRERKHAMNKEFVDFLEEELTKSPSEYRPLGVGE